MKSIGFIGSGRATRIILGGLKKAGQNLDEVIVYDVNETVVDELIKENKTVKSAGKDSEQPAKCDIVFISLHPPVFIEEIKKIKESIKNDAIVISLAPKIKIEKIREVLGSNKNIVRLIPNSPSIIGKGFNPAFFSEGFDPDKKNEVISFLEKLGRLAEVKEELLESYSVITAMGPTYFLFQWKELLELAKSFGMTEKDATQGVTEMLRGSVYLFAENDMEFSRKNDLVPVKPLQEEEENVKNIFRTRLNLIFNKLKS